MDEELTAYTLNLTSLEKDTLLVALLILEANYPDYPRREALGTLMEKVVGVLEATEALS